MTSLWLETGTTPDFAPAQRLYESMGWRRDEEALHYALYL